MGSGNTKGQRTFRIFLWVFALLALTSIVPRLVARYSFDPYVVRVSQALSFVPYVIGALVLGVWVLFPLVRGQMALDQADRVPIALLALPMFFFCCAGGAVYSAILFGAGRERFSPPFTVECHPPGWGPYTHYTVFVTPAQLALARELLVAIPAGAVLVISVLVMLRRVSR